MEKTKITIDRDVANRMKSIMLVGETYSDIIRRLLDEKGIQVQALSKQKD